MAPSRVAIARRIAAGSAEASRACSLASSAAACISPNRLRSLLLAALSVPIATFTPCAAQFADPANPDASFMFDCGQCTDVAPVCRQQGDVLVAQVRHVHALGAGAEQAEPVQRVQRAFAVFFDSAFSTSRAVSCRWICTGASSSAASVAIFARLASHTV